MIAALQRPDPPAPRVGVEEFLSWPEDDGRTRYQLVDGTPVAMAPPSRRHGRIQSRLAGILNQHLRGHRCQVSVGTGVQPRSDPHWNVRIPDLVVDCDPPQDDAHLVRNPLLVIEILSPGNERLTRGNVWVYRDLPSVRDILLLYSWKIGGESLRRDADSTWPVDATVLGAESRLRLESIGLDVPLADAYATSGL